MGGGLLGGDFSLWCHDDRSTTSPFLYDILHHQWTKGRAISTKQNINKYWKYKQSRASKRDIYCYGQSHHQLDPGDGFLWGFRGIFGHSCGAKCDHSLLIYADCPSAVGPQVEEVWRGLFGSCGRFIWRIGGRETILGQPHTVSVSSHLVFWHLIHRSCHYQVPIESSLVAGL